MTCESSPVLTCHPARADSDRLPQQPGSTHAALQVICHARSRKKRSSAMPGHGTGPGDKQQTIDCHGEELKKSGDARMDGLAMHGGMGPDGSHSMQFALLSSPMGRAAGAGQTLERNMAGLDGYGSSSWLPLHGPRLPAGMHARAPGFFWTRGARHRSIHRVCCSAAAKIINRSF